MQQKPLFMLPLRITKEPMKGNEIPSRRSIMQHKMQQPSSITSPETMQDACAKSRQLQEMNNRKLFVQNIHTATKLRVIKFNKFSSPVLLHEKTF